MKISLWHCHAMMVEDDAFSYIVGYVAILLEILNLKGHPNLITDSRVPVILLNGWILPIGGPSADEGMQSTGLPRLLSSLVSPIF